MKFPSTIRYVLCYVNQNIMAISTESYLKKTTRARKKSHLVFHQLGNYHLKIIS